MRKLLISFLLNVVLLGAAEAGDLHSKRAEIYFDWNQGASNLTTTVGNFSGYIQELFIDISGANATGTVSLTASGPLSTLASRTVFTTNMTSAADIVVRPRFNGHTSVGVDLATDSIVSEPFMAAGETFTFAATNTVACTNVTYILLIKYSDSK